MNNPFFSIIVPTYNRKFLIKATLDSVLSQNNRDYEIIVVDDGSTDNSSEIIRKKYGEKVTIISIPNSERGKARNTGTNHAKGQYIYFLDSDDLLYPNHLEQAFLFIQILKNPEWIFQEYEFLNKVTGKTTQIQYSRRQPLKSLVAEGNFISCHGVFLRKDIAKKHLFEENRDMAGSEDYALWLRLAARYPLYINHTITSALVQHEARSVFNFAPDKLIQRKELMLKKVLSDPEFNLKFSKFIPRLKANTFSYISLHLAMINSKQKALDYFLKSFWASPGSVFTRTFSSHNQTFTQLIITIFAPNAQYSLSFI